MSFATYKISPRNISLEKSDLKKIIDYVLQKTRETHEAHKQELTLNGQTEEAKWPAPGSEDTELGVLMEREVRHGAAEVHARVQA